MVYPDRLSSRRRGSNIIKIDGWTLPGPSVPTLSPRHFWIHFGSLLEDRFGTHFCSISEAVSGLILELIWSAESILEGSRKAYAETQARESPDLRREQNGPQILPRSFF